MSFMRSRTARFQRACRHVPWRRAGHYAGSPERHFSGGMAPENSMDWSKRLIVLLDIIQVTLMYAPFPRSIAHDWPRTFLALQEEAQRHANQQFAPPAPDHGCLPAAIQHRAKTIGGNTENTGNLPNKPSEPLLDNDIKELKRNGSAPGVCRKPGGNRRKLAETPAETVHERRRLYGYPRPVTRVSASMVSHCPQTSENLANPAPRTAPGLRMGSGMCGKCGNEVRVL